MNHMKSLLSLLVLSAGVAFAQTSLVTSSAALNPNDSVDWSQFAGATVPSGSVATTANASTVTVSLANPSASFNRVNQAVSWSGNFLPNEPLLWSFNTGAITVDPSLLVFGAGTQIQADYFGAFTAQIQAFDSLNNLIGSVSASGSSTSANDGSALYIGFTSTTAVDYFKILLTSAVVTTEDFSIGHLDLLTEGRNPPPVTPVPEPSTYGLMAGAALAGLGLLRRRRKA
jgi:hypothetical protein